MGMFSHVILVVYSLSAIGQDFHRKLLSLYVDSQLARTIFVGDRTFTKAIGSKIKGNYLSNILSIQLEKSTYFIKNDCSRFCA